MIKYQIMPESVEQDMTVLKDDVLKTLSDIDVRNTAEKPIAFGLKALEIVIVIPDRGGDTDAIEEKLAGVSGVQNVNVLALDLL